MVLNPFGCFFRELSFFTAGRGGVYLLGGGAGIFWDSQRGDQFFSGGQRGGPEFQEGHRRGNQEGGTNFFQWVKGRATRIFGGSQRGDPNFQWGDQNFLRMPKGGTGEHRQTAPLPLKNDSSLTITCSMIITDSVKIPCSMSTLLCVYGSNITLYTLIRKSPTCFIRTKPRGSGVITKPVYDTYIPS